MRTKSLKKKSSSYSSLCCLTYLGCREEETAAAETQTPHSRVSNYTWAAGHHQQAIGRSTSVNLQRLVSLGISSIFICAWQTSASPSRSSTVSPSLGKPSGLLWEELIAFFLPPLYSVHSSVLIFFFSSLYYCLWLSSPLDCEFFNSSDLDSLIF